MNSAIRLPLVIALGASILVHTQTTTAISYEAWLNPAMAGPLVVVTMMPAGDGSVSTYTTVQADTRPVMQGHPEADWEVATRPIGGWIGSLALEVQPHTSIRWPLQIRLLYSPVLEKDLFPPANKNVENLVWQRPMNLLNPNAVIRSETFEETIGITNISPADKISIPLILPQQRNLPSMFDDSRYPLLSCRCEVVDATGDVLLRSLPVELFMAQSRASGGSTTWVMGDSAADQLIRDVAMSEPIIVKELPTDFLPYLEVGSLWLSQQAWDGQRPDPELLRKLLLTGRRLLGPPAVLNSLCTELALKGPKRILLGGVNELIKDSRDARRKKANHYLPALSLWDDYIYQSKKGEAYPLGNREDLFAPNKRGLTIWTVGTLVCYGVVAAVILPLGFLRLKGPRRVMLWWLTPCLAFLFGVVGLVMGRVLIPLTPRLDVSEYRFCYAPWNEVYCQDVVRLLTFDDRAVSFQMAKDGLLLPGNTFLEQTGKSRSTHIQRDENQFSWERTGPHAGQIILDDAGRFIQTSAPARIVTGDHGPQVHAMESLRSIHILQGDAWRVLGDLKQGESKDLSAGTSTNLIYGLPNILAGLFDWGHWGSAQDIYNDISDEPLTNSPFGSDMVMVAVADESTGLQSKSHEAATSERIIWIVQFPQEQAVAKAGDPVAP